MTIAVQQVSTSPAPHRRNHRRGLGSVRADELLPLAELQRRLGWGHKGAAKAQRAGLRTIQFGKMKYVLGADLLAWFRDLGDKQRGETRKGE